MEARRKKHKLRQSDIPLTEDQKRIAAIMAVRINPLVLMLQKPRGRLVAHSAARVHDWEEVESAAWLGLLDAARTWDESKNVKPQTWAWYKVYDRVLYLTRYKKCVLESIGAHVSIYTENESGHIIADQIADDSGDQLTRMVADEHRRKIASRIRRAIRGLSKTDREIIRLRYGLTPGGKPMEFLKIAQTLGRCEAWAWRSHRRIIETLQKKLEDCNND